VRRYYNNRISIRKDQVTHFNVTTGRCFICGEPALHAVGTDVKEGGRLYLCTKHLSKIFKTPTNRFPRKKRAPVKKINKNVGTFKLRRHMDLPYIFEGQRLVCHRVDFGPETWYFTLYWRDGGSANPLDHVLSVTRILGETKYAIHQAQEFDGYNDSIIEQLKYLMHTHDGVLEIGKNKQVILGLEMTSFIEQVMFHAKKLTPENQKKVDLLVQWRLTQLPPAGTITIGPC
jgi:hypothetical protein